MPTLTTSVSSLESSIHSPRPGRSNGSSSHIPRAYRQAAQLFLTRRLPEALTTIEPVITPAPASFDARHTKLKSPASVNGDSDERASLNGGLEEDTAPIATASRGTRVKVWSFYASLLNAIVELGPDEGKTAFGAVRWRGIVSRVRDGAVWDEVAKIGYGGEDAALEPDVVINLATLMLTHASTQTLTQQKLENYLSANANPTFDLTSHFSGASTPTITPSNPYGRRPSQAPTPAGAATPRDLHARLKLVELYALHVLPRNGEWELAHGFLSNSELLDDERKEAFLNALDTLKREMEELETRQKEAEAAQVAEEARKLKEQEEERKRQEEADRIAESQRERRRRESKSSMTKEKKSLQGQPGSSSRPNSNAHPSNKRNRNPPPQRPPASMVERVSTLVRSFATSLNRTAVMRGLMMLLLVWILLGRKTEFRQVLAIAYRKLMGTLGMGVKVSYI